MIRLERPVSVFQSLSLQVQRKTDAVFGGNEVIWPEYHKGKGEDN